MARRVWVLEHRDVEHKGEWQASEMVDPSDDNPRRRAAFLKECRSNGAPGDRYRIVAYYPKEAK